MMTILRAIALGAACLISSAAFAQQYPTKPVKIVIPFTLDPRSNPDTDMESVA